MHVLEVVWKQDFVAIYVVPALCACRGRAWKADLSIFTVFQPSLHVLGVAWKADFVDIYGIPALFACLGIDL